MGSQGKIGVRLVNSLFPSQRILVGKREFTSLTPIFPCDPIFLVQSRP